MTSIGNVEVHWSEDGEEPPERKGVLASQTTFMRYQKVNHSSLLVSDPSKDICTLCHVFANRHKYNALNNDLFLPESECVKCNKDSITSSIEFSNEPLDILLSVLQAQSDKLNLEIKTMNDVMVSLKEQLPAIPAGDEKVGLYESMKSRASHHVDCAMVQHLLYRTLVLKARLHCKNDVPHSDKSYIFVVDYGQNIDVSLLAHLNQTILIILHP